jgi:hypothetical protein
MERRERLLVDDAARLSADGLLELRERETRLRTALAVDLAG